MKTIKLILLVYLFLFAEISFSQTKTDSKKTDKRTHFIQVTRDKMQAFQQSFNKSWNKTFTGFSKNEISLYGAINFSKQRINNQLISTPFNYNLVNEKSFKPGFVAGARIDGLYKKKYNYGFQMSLSMVNAGNYYINKARLEPFLGDFTQYKFDSQFATFNLSALYKKSIFFSTSKYKLYAVAGPGLDIRVTAFSNDQHVKNTGSRLFANGHLGIEFNDNGYYLLFLHYKHGFNVFHSPAPVQLSSFELGIAVTTKDLF
jgi:hypothetical protein